MRWALPLFWEPPATARIMNRIWKELGAAEERDDIYASMDYCPITDLPHADLA